MNKLNIGLDIDGVLADFPLAWFKLYPDTTPTPKGYDYDKKMSSRFKQMKTNNMLDDFFLNMPTLIKPEDIPFEPCCYITARPVNSSITEKWLEKHGFPKKPVITVGLGISKIEATRKNNINIFIDDNYDNFIELNENGIFCYLYTASWNTKYDVGDMRIDSLKDLSLIHPALTD